MKDDRLIPITQAKPEPEKKAEAEKPGLKIKNGVDQQYTRNISDYLVVSAYNAFYNLMSM